MNKEKSKEFARSIMDQLGFECGRDKIKPNIELVTASLGRLLRVWRPEELEREMPRVGKELGYLRFHDHLYNRKLEIELAKHLPHTVADVLADAGNGEWSPVKYVMFRHHHLVQILEDAILEKVPDREPRLIQEALDYHVGQCLDFTQFPEDHA